MKSRVFIDFNASFSLFVSRASALLKSWVIAYIDLHLFITAISIPVLSHWGMPVSMLTIVGNFLFAPFCSLFLWLSAIIYMTELMYIPNQSIIDVLDMLRRAWEYCLTFGSARWLVAFRHYHLLLTILFLAIPIGLLWLCAKKRSLRMWSLCVWIGFLYALSLIGTHATFTLKTEYGEFYCVSQNNKLIVVDPGILLKSARPEHFFAYHFGPSLAKSIGSTCVDYYILLKPSIRSFQALTHSFEKLNIKNIIIPTWQGETSKRMWRYFFELRRTIQDHECQLIRVGAHKKIIPTDVGKLVINPTEEKTKIGTHECADYTVSFKKDDQEFLIYYNPLCKKTGCESFDQSKD